MPWGSRAASSVKTSSIASRVRVSPDGSGCVYVRSVKPESEWPGCSESAMPSPASRNTEAQTCRWASIPSAIKERSFLTDRSLTVYRSGHGQAESI